MTILSNIDYFKELPYFNEVIEKPKIKRLKNVDLLAEQPFYEQLGIIKTDEAFNGYAMVSQLLFIEVNKLLINLLKKFSKNINIAEK